MRLNCKEQQQEFRHFIGKTSRILEIFYFFLTLDNAVHTYFIVGGRDMSTPLIHGHPMSAWFTPACFKKKTKNRT